MSFDPKQNTPPMGHAAPKKSGALKWILGGIGCFTLMIVLCVGGVSYFGYKSYQMVANNPAFLKAVNSIEDSQSVADALGGPVSVDKAPSNVQTNAAGDNVSMTYNCEVKGANSTGMAEITVSGKPFGEDWTIDSLKVTGPDGEEIPVDEISLDLDIDEGIETNEN